MRIAGVRLPDGSAVWLNAGEQKLAPLDRVHGSTAGGDVEGIVFVTPEQLVQVSVQVAGTITDVERRQHRDAGCDELPGADLPPLGTAFEAEGVHGVVVELDPVGRRVTIRRGEGEAGAVTVSAGSARAPRV